MALPIDKSYLLTQLRNFKSVILDPAYIIQKTTLPTANASNEGKVFQYIGTDSTNYTIGGFYQCQSDGAATPTYSWVKISKEGEDNFVGTLAQWNALPLAEKIKFKTADITDDFNGSPIDSALSDTSINPVQNRVVKSAIDTLTDVLSPIGQVLFGAGESTTFSVPDNMDTTTYSITLPAGIWLVIGHANWAANTVGYRQLSFGQGANPVRDQAVLSIPASTSNKQHYMQIVRVFQLHATTTLNLYARQSSGDNLMIYPQLTAIRIK